MSEEQRIARQPPSFSGQALVEGGNDFQVQIGDRWVKDPHTQKWIKRNDTRNSDDERDSVPKTITRDLTSFETSPKSLPSMDVEKQTQTKKD